MDRQLDVLRSFSAGAHQTGEELGHSLCAGGDKDPHLPRNCTLRELADLRIDSCHSKAFAFDAPYRHSMENPIPCQPSSVPGARCRRHNLVPQGAHVVRFLDHSETTSSQNCTQCIQHDLRDCSGTLNHRISDASLLNSSSRRQPEPRVGVPGHPNPTCGIRTRIHLDHCSGSRITVLHHGQTCKLQFLGDLIGQQSQSGFNVGPHVLEFRHVSPTLHHRPAHPFEPSQDTSFTAIHPRWQARLWKPSWLPPAHQPRR